MKRILALLTIICVVFSSCTKSTDKSDILQQFISSIHPTELNVKSYADIANPMNPYDDAGVIHNEMVTSIIQTRNNECDSLDFINCINKYSDFEIENLNVFRLLINSIYPKIFDAEGTYKGDLVNNLINIPELEKATINTFFQNITNYSAVSDKISACINSEKFIIESCDYTKESKERILSCLAIYRYSTYLWDIKLGSSQDKNFKNWSNIYDVFDAIGEYLALQTDIPWDEYHIDIQDGKDVYRFAGMVSLSAAISFSFIDPVGLLFK